MRTELRILDFYQLFTALNSLREKVWRNIWRHGSRGCFVSILCPQMSDVPCWCGEQAVHLVRTSSASPRWTAAEPLVPGCLDPLQRGSAVSDPKAVQNGLLGCKYILKHFSHHQLLGRKITPNPSLLYGSQMTEKSLHMPAIKWCVMRCFSSWPWKRWNHSMKQRGKGKTEESAYIKPNPLQERRHWFCCTEGTPKKGNHWAWCWKK